MLEIDIGERLARAGLCSLGGRPRFSGPASRLSEWLWRAHSACRENDFRGCVWPDSPGRVDG
jgi:hypothetical protein